MAIHDKLRFDGQIEEFVLASGNFYKSSMPYDVAVIGGGPAGAATALALARSGCSVVVAERAAAPTLRVGETLPPRIRLVLEQLGVWDEFSAADHIPSVGNRSTWGAADPVDHDFIFNPYGAGWHIDRQRFDEMFRRAATRAGATVVPGLTLIGSTPTVDGGWRLEFSGLAERAALNARFVVDASGRASAFARRCGSARRVIDRLVGVVGYFELAPSSKTEPGARVTLVEAAEHGWWYSALLPEGKLVAVYMTDADVATARQAGTEAGWMTLIRQTEQTRARIEVSDYRLTAVPRIVSAHSSCLTTVASSSWLAVGDAAATYDPLSSQGIATALSTALEAATAIRAQFDGRPGALATYARQLAQGYARYLSNRAAYYAIEQRWPDSLFWQRRHGAKNRTAQSKGQSNHG